MSHAAPPRVLIADDSDFIIERVTATLSADCEIVGAVKNGPAALEAVQTLKPDVLVLDISMPGMSGIEVICRLRRAGWTTPTVFLTVHDDESTVLATQEAGGIGFVVKTHLPSDLRFAVSEARAGRRYVSGIR